MNRRSEWTKRGAVLIVLILSATLARMIAEKAGTQADPWVVLGKVGMIAGLTSIVYGIAFLLADIAAGDVKLNIGRHVGKLVIGGVLAINGAMIGAILGGFGQ